MVNKEHLVNDRSLTATETVTSLFSLTLLSFPSRHSSYLTHHILLIAGLLICKHSSSRVEVQCEGGIHIVHSPSSKSTQTPGSQ